MVQDRYFFCGIGGSGMLPLALYLDAAGAVVRGSDRAFDQGRNPHLKARLEEAGIPLFPQDGSGPRGEETFVTSAAVEATIPDVAAAIEKGAERKIRAEVLASLTNSARISCGIAGTSGKSTVTGMIAHILAASGRDPSVVNGAPILNFGEAWRQGGGPFVAEVDESDGSIAGYDPRIGVILNVSEDHKPMAELENLFGGYADRSERVVLGIDSDPVALIARAMPSGKAVTFSLLGDADFSVRELETHEGGCRSLVSTRSGEVTLDLPLIGAFNIGNALAAMAAADLMGVSAEESAEHLRAFRGTARRLERVGSKGGITVIDDFAHNPEKIAASIGALTRHYAGLHILYQPHGYGPLRSFRPLYEKAFAEVLRPHDRLTLTEPVYFGGTVTKSDDAELLAKTLKQAGFKAQYVTHRDDFRRETKSFTEGDAVVVMGARDDGLTIFARELLGELT